MSADPWEPGSLPTCYRHPDRETRLACSSCGRSACVDCLQSASVGQKCHECAQPGGQERRATSGQSRGGGRLRSAPATFAILGLAVAVWVVTFVAPDLAEIIFAFGVQDNAAVARGEWYRLFTAAFLHSPGLLHILVNMLALYLFGPPLEREAGSIPFAALFLAAALAGGAAFFVLNPPLIGGGPRAVGASGAIFGLLGAWLAASLRQRNTPAGQAYLRNLLLILGINLALPFVPGAGDRIAWEAHVGGLVGGFLIALGWLSVRTSGRAKALRTVVAAAVGLASLFLVGL